MAITLGDAIFFLRGDKTDLDKVLKESESDAAASAGRTEGLLKNIGGGIKDFIGTASKVAIGGAIGGFVALGAAIGGGVADAREAALIMAQTEQVIKTTGGAAGLTAQQIADMAGQMSAASGKSLFGDDLIQQGQNVLLTFTNIGKEVFPMATQAALDMAQATGKTPEAMSMLIGKALNSADAMSALRKQGVAFTDEQVAMGKAMFEAGDIAGYQKLVLGELNVEFGGQAEAAAKADGGMAQFKDTVGELFESIGGSLLPVLNMLMSLLNSDAAKAGMQAFADLLTNGLAAAIAWLSDTGIPALINGWNTISPAVAVVIAVIGQVIAAFQSGGQGSQELAGVMTFLGTTFMQVKDIIVLAVQIIQAILVPIIAFITQFVTDHQNEILHIIQNVWLAIQTTIGGVLGLIKGILTAVMQAINGDWSGAWTTIKQTCADFVLAIIKLIELNFDTIKTIFGGLVTAAIAKMVELKDGVVTKFGEIVTGAKTKVGEFVDIGANIVAGIRQGIADQWDSFMNWIDRQIDKIPKAVRDALGIHSPSTVMYELGAPIIDGLTNGMLARLPNLLAGVKTVTDSIVNQVQSIQTKIQNILGDMFGGRASFGRTMSGNINFVASLRQGLEEYGKLNDEIFNGLDKRMELGAQIDALNAAGMSMSPEDRIKNQEKINKLQAEYAENEAKIAENQAKLRDEQEQRNKLNQLASDTQGLLATATADAKQFNDPREAAAFLKLRSDQIKEMASLQKELILAKDATEQKDIQDQIDIIKAAQEADLAQFKYKQAASGTSNGDDLRDLITALNDFIHAQKVDQQFFNLNVYGTTIDGQSIIQGYDTLHAMAGTRS